MDRQRDTISNQEMAIPKSASDVVFLFVIYLIIVVFMFLAILNIFLRIAIICSCIWIAFITIKIWPESRMQGGLRRFLTNRLGDIFGRHFAEIASQALESKEIRFGYELFGRRYFTHTVIIDRIETVEWKTGQATDMAGRDMNDWHVCMWYDHCDPVESEKRQKLYRKPDQDLYVVGPLTTKNKTEALGTEFVAFLRAAGAALVQGEKSNCFVRAGTKQLK